MCALKHTGWDYLRRKLHWTEPDKHPPTVSVNGPPHPAKGSNTPPTNGSKPALKPLRANLRTPLQNEDGITAFVNGIRDEMRIGGSNAVN